MNETLVYVVGIPNSGKEYAYSVTIDNAVIEAGYRYAEIERMVTGTNHVMVNNPNYYDGSIDEEVFVSLDLDDNIVLCDKPLYMRAAINIRDADAMRSPVTRLLTWIVLTDEYGKPADKYIDDFLFNFGGAIKHDRLHLSEKQRKRFDDAFLNDDHYRFTGGFDFYVDLITFAKRYRGRKFKTDIRSFIKSWHSATNC